MSTEMEAGCVVDFGSYGLSVKDAASVDIGIVTDIGTQIVDNFKTYGFCYLKNHGVDKQLLDKYRDISKTFFELPDSVKEQYPLGVDYMTGYVKLGKETLNNDRSAGDLHEAFNYVPMFEKGWPPIDQFEALTKQFYDSGKALALRLFDVLTPALNLPNDALRNAHTTHLQIRTIYYPVIKDNWNVEADQARLGEHTDWGTLTLNFQDNTGGLEVQTPDGKFVAVNPIPGTCVITPSVLLQRWTSDTVKASLHRVLVPKDERRQKVRQALIFFVNPNKDVKMRSLDGSGKYSPILTQDYFHSRAQYAQKNN